jgi:hypothetical protein
MIYKDKIQLLLETLDSKLNIVQNVATGQMRLDVNDLMFVIQDCKRIRQQIEELISIER